MQQDRIAPDGTAARRWIVMASVPIGDDPGWYAVVHRETTMPVAHYRERGDAEVHAEELESGQRETPTWTLTLS